MKKAVLGTVLFAGVVLAAGAQSIAVIDLEAGFSPDPTTVEIVAEVYDNEEVEFDFGPAEVFMDGAEPHVGINYEAGSYPLYIQFVSAIQADTVIIVVTPDGEILTNDDAVGLDPGVIIESPMSGSYAVGIGSWSEGEVFGTLYISEIGFQEEGAAMSGEALDSYEPVLLFLGDEMQLSYTDGYAVIEPDAGRRVADIVRYYINEQMFDEYFPAGYSNSDGEWQIEGYIIRTLRAEDGVRPVDSRSQAPAGGFSVRDYEVLIMDAFPSGR